MDSFEGEKKRGKKKFNTYKLDEVCMYLFRVRRGVKVCQGIWEADTANSQKYLRKTKTEVGRTSIKTRRYTIGINVFLSAKSTQAEDQLTFFFSSFSTFFPHQAVLRQRVQLRSRTEKSDVHTKAEVFIKVKLSSRFACGTSVLLTQKLFIQIFRIFYQKYMSVDQLYEML